MSEAQTLCFACVDHGYIIARDKHVTTPTLYIMPKLLWLTLDLIDGFSLRRYPPGLPVLGTTYNILLIHKYLYLPLSLYIQIHIDIDICKLLSPEEPDQFKYNILLDHFKLDAACHLSSRNPYSRGAIQALTSLCAGDSKGCSGFASSVSR